MVGAREMGLCITSVLILCTLLSFYRKIPWNCFSYPLLSLMPYFPFSLITCSSPSNQVFFPILQWKPSCHGFSMVAILSNPILNTQFSSYSKSHHLMLCNFCLVNRLRSLWKIILVKIIYTVHPNKSLGQPITSSLLNPMVNSQSYLTWYIWFSCLSWTLSSPVLWDSSLSWFSWRLSELTNWPFLLSLILVPLLFPLDFVCYEAPSLTLSPFPVCFSSLPRWFYLVLLVLNENLWADDSLSKLYLSLGPQFTLKFSLKILFHLWR